MKIRLSGGVVASGRHAWIARPSGPRRLLDQADARPGTPVALGPERAPAGDVANAVRELSLLVADGGAVAAGAGVDLGGGFRSARLDGARGDQRDAVLAALRTVGLHGADRLGERAGVLVALFGPAVTRRVGAAAARAAEEGRWAALHLASAASDVLGPEQLERVLALEAPEGVDLTPGGSPSVLAGYLRQVLEQVSPPRRLALILDLWERVAERRTGLARRDARLATQSRRDRVADLRKRRRHDDDEHILWQVRIDLENEQPSLADIARWTPGRWYWHERLQRVFADAIAATALLGTAAAVADHGLEDGLERSAPVLRAAASLMPDWAAGKAARRVPGLTGLPVRPGAYVRDLARRLAAGKPMDAKFAAYTRPRLACARDFALVVIEDVGRVMGDMVGTHDDLLREWSPSLQSWREGAGYGRPPAEWDGIAPWTGPMLGDLEPLRRRLTPDQDPATAETAADLLWYADLVDALARLYGHERAQPTPGTGDPWFDHDPPPAGEPSPNVTGGLSMARQLGLGVSRIVIDPGHGGHDPGAQGADTTESELVLDVALRLEKLLAKRPGVEVVLTRRDNQFVTLQERTAIANREGADLFLSIHANASAVPAARGIETYFLNFASNQNAAAVAARENATSDQTMGVLQDVVKAIALNSKRDESRDFATYVQREMLESLRSANKTIKDLGVKQAPFVVLIGASMPSVLAEISFLTNPQEAKLLKSSGYRQRIAQALFEGIKDYQTSLKNASAIAQQH